MKSKKRVGERRHDRPDGNRLQSRYIGRLPEGKKQSLKQQIRQELDHLLSQNPDLKLVVTADQRTIGRSPKASTPIRFLACHREAQGRC